MNKPWGYREVIANLLASTPFAIDPDLKVTGKPPTLASSEFLTNKQQGDWAEQIVLAAINENSPNYRAVKYGRSESLAAGDPGFDEFYQAYQDRCSSRERNSGANRYARAQISHERIGKGPFAVRCYVSERAGVPGQRGVHK